MSVVWIAGGAPALAETVRRVAAQAGADARLVPAEGHSRESGDTLIDLGQPPAAWTAASEDAERARVQALAAGGPRGIRVVRTSFLGTGEDRTSAVLRAHAVAEAAWESAGADLVRLRHGLVLGPFGLHAAWHRAVERFRVVPVPAFDVRFEAILDEDLAAYCAEAAEPARRPDPVYDLGCGDMATNGFYVGAVARELGRSRGVFPVPSFLRGVAARLIAGPDLPFEAAWLALEVFADTRLPRRMSAWSHFAIRPADFADSIPRSLGRVVVHVDEEPEAPFASWRRNRKRPKPFLKR